MPNYEKKSTRELSYLTAKKILDLNKDELSQLSNHENWRDISVSSLKKMGLWNEQGQQEQAYKCLYKYYKEEKRDYRREVGSWTLALACSGIGLLALPCVPIIYASDKFDPTQKLSNAKDYKYSAVKHNLRSPNAAEEIKQRSEAYKVQHPRLLSILTGAERATSTQEAVHKA